MPKIGVYEEEVLAAFEKGQLHSVASKKDLAKFKLVAHATAIKDRRGSGDRGVAPSVPEDSAGS